MFVVSFPERTTGISVANVKVRAHRVRARLGAILEKHCTFEADERNVLVSETVCGGEKPKGSSE